MADRSVEFQLEFLDNISETTERAAQSQENLGTQVQATTAAVVQQDVSFIKTVASLSALRMGVTGVFHSLITLGVVGDEGARVLMKMAAGMTIFVGAAQAVKGVVGLVNQLKNAEIALAAVETYRAVLKNPAALGLVATGIGAGAGLAGYFYGKSQGGGGGGTTVNQSITFQGTSGADSRGSARESLELMGGY